MDHRRSPQFVFEESAKSMAGPAHSHVSIVEHGVPVMIICGAKTQKEIDVSVRPSFLILTGKCSGRTGWRLKAGFCTMGSFAPASNNVGKAWQGRYFSMLALLNMAAMMICAAKNAKNKITNDVSARKHLLMNDLGMDALANGWVGSMDVVIVWAWMH